MALQAGDVVGRWTLLYPGRLQDKTRKKIWLCRCECLCIREVLEGNLLTGKTVSCGCWRLEMISERPEYTVWRDMLARCLNPKDPGYHRYGGRGITVTLRWQHSFQAFYEAMGPRPSPDHSIERIDNDRGYESGNCRWATQVEQARNRRTNHILTFQGRALPLVAWAEETGIPDDTLLHRLKKEWSVEQALTTPVISSSERARRANAKRWGCEPDSAAEAYWRFWILRDLHCVPLEELHGYYLSEGDEGADQSEDSADWAKWIREDLYGAPSLPGAW